VAALSAKTADRLATCDRERAALEAEGQRLQAREAELVEQSRRHAAARQAYEYRRGELSRHLVAARDSRGATRGGTG
jgi:hypothetical protein